MAAAKYKRRLITPEIHACIADLETEGMRHFQTPIQYVLWDVDFSGEKKREKNGELDVCEFYQGRHKWEEVRKNSKDQAIEYEDQRMRALTDWEYEPIDDRLAGRAIYDDFRKTYHSLDPIRVTHLPSIFSGRNSQESALE